MSIERIEQPLAGERVLGLSPATAAAAVLAWLRRPHLFPGRALTTAALQQRQQWQAGRIAVRGQNWVAGVTDGLELSCAPNSAGTGFAATRVRVERGRALTVGGEDVVLHRSLECSLADVPVVAPDSFFVDGSGVGDPNADGSLRARRIGAALGKLGAASLATLPPVGVLVLQPVRVETAPFDRTDPCDRSACDEGTIDDVQAFEDWREADAARLLWYVWPSEWRSLAASEAHLRNVLAWTIFQAEAELPRDEALPWAYPWGAPLALVHLDGQRQPLWVDRASVVRAGGRARDARLRLTRGNWGSEVPPRARLPLAADSRLASLWQAQIEQFAEQVAARIAEPDGAQRLREGFGRFLPPVGLLPREVFDFSTAGGNTRLRTDFFPDGFDVDAVPAPTEQLDLGVRASAALAPLNVSMPESVRVMVPVPLSVWEPRLLLREVIDPEFDTTLHRFLLTRARELGGRQGLRERSAVLERAITGVRPDVLRFNDDPAALEPEALSPWGPPPAGGGHRSSLRAGVHQHYFERASAPFPVSGDRLYCWALLDPDNPPRTLMLQWHVSGQWEHRAFWGEDDLINWGVSGTPSRARIGDLPEAGRWVRLEVPTASVGLAANVALDGMAFTLFDGQAAFGVTGVTSGTTETEWFRDVLPEGAQRLGDEPWEMLSHNDLWAPFEPALGVLPAQPGTMPPAVGGHFDAPAPGMHQHFVDGPLPGNTAFVPFQVNAGDALFCWVYLDPNNPPREVMLQWRTQNFGWERRAFWGFDLIAWGTSGQASRLRVGSLPRPGRWLRLQVSAKDLELEGGALIGLAFTLFDGHAAFGAAGAFAAATANAGAGPERVWFAGAAPAGALLRGSWNFLAPLEQRTPTSASMVGQVQAIADLYEHPALSVLSPQERTQVYLLGAQGFADYLQARADRADDAVDYGFVKVQTDVYRVRQLMLGATAATRLTVSPALASIAQAETAVASQSQISNFLNDLKQKAAAPPAPTPPPPSPTPAPPPAPAPAPAGNPFVFTPIFTNVRAPLLMAAPAAAAGAATKVQNRTLPVKAIAAAGDIAPIARRVDHVAALAATPREIANAQPGGAQPFVRTTTLAKRLEEPKSKEARDYASQSRLDAIESLLRLYDELTDQDGGVTPGLFAGLDVRGLKGDTFLEDVNAPQNQPKPVSRPFAHFIVDRTLLAKLAVLPVRLVGTDPDESAYFSDTTDLADHVVALMRQVEARVKRYREALAVAQQTLAALRANQATLRIGIAGNADRLAEARHDVSVARAIVAEEQERIAAVNARRERVLAEDVKFVLFVRPRETDNLLTTPTHSVDPGLIDPPVPTCLRLHPDVPDELDDMLRVLREAPANWFVSAPPILRRLDRIEPLVRMLQTAQLRALAGIAAPLLSAQKAPEAPATAAFGTAKVQGAIQKVAMRQAEVLSPRLTALREFDFTAITAATWQGVRVRAEEVVSFADLAEGGHGRADVARAAATELQNMRSISACLHAEFSAVLPSLRLDWAEVLSEFDEAPNLRNLANLPRWNEIGTIDRRQMQSYVDWLFAQIEPNQAQAVALMNDVVRMCLLLASHAPVDRIIAGRLPKPIPGVKPGLHIPISIFDPTRLRVGMYAVLMREQVVVARAVVQDVGKLEVSAQVVQTKDAQVDLGTDVRVHFDDAAMLSLKGASAMRSLFGR